MGEGDRDNREGNIRKRVGGVEVFEAGTWELEINWVLFK